MIKHTLKKILPKRIITKLSFIKLFFSLAKEYKLDMKKYWSYSASIKNDFIYDKNKLQGRMIVLYHAIEKGLSLPNKDRLFGIEKRENLIELMKFYDKHFGKDSLYFYCKEVLNEHEKWIKINYPKAENYLKVDEEFDSDNHTEKFKGGLKKGIHKQTFINQKDYKKFVLSRHSIRSFVNKKVSDKKISDAIKLAIHSPSVCNRQPWKVYKVSKEPMKKQILDLQRGNQGFGHLASDILVITSDLNYFQGVNERNQGYIEGGIFSMSIIYALHSQNIGTCCLNLSINNNVEKKLKSILPVPRNEIFIMMIAVGAVPDNIRVAFSERKSLDKIYLDLDENRNPNV
tara:strand:- start:1679 stop:2710 length:1032 start_codon:yes stop_codon:yes gene_type:complete